MTDPPAPAADAPRARSACVVAGARPDAVAALAGEAAPAARVRANRLGALVTGRLGGLPVDCAQAFAGPVYDVLYNPTSGWLSVTVFRGEDPPVRWDNRPGADAGYPRVVDILGATTAAAILDALDVPAEAIGYVLA
jgi:hypothetical protein